MKQVHWQLPFASLKGVAYRIDIYAEGAPVGGIKQLTGGATPFVTDEDNSDDFFAPVRGWTGMINVVDADGTLIETIMPDDNVSHMVRLIRVSDEEIEWQGFLSCEAYSQEYTDRPTEISIPVKSVLEAMKYANLRVEDASYKQIRWLVKDCFEFMYNAGANIGKFLYPVRSWKILTKYIDTTIMYDKKENTNEDSTIYTIVGISLYEAICRLCQFMGWTLFEYGNNFIFCDKLGDGRYYNDAYGHFRVPVSSLPVTEIVNMGSMRMMDISYGGTGHQIDIMNGAKSVEVVSTIEPYKLDMSIPECPYLDLIEVIPHGSTFWSGCINPSFNSLIGIYAMKGIGYSNPLQGYLSLTYDRQSTIEESIINGCGFDWYYFFINGDSSKNYNIYTTAYFARAFTSISTYGDINSALIIQGVPTRRFEDFRVGACFSYTYDNSLFRMNSGLPLKLSTGWLRLRMTEESIKKIAYKIDREPDRQYIDVYVKFGDYYWNGLSWQNSFCAFQAHLKGDGSLVSNKTIGMKTKEEDGIFMEISSVMRGTVEIGITYGVNILCKDTDGYYDDSTTAIISSLSVDYVLPDDRKLSDRSENHYYKLFGLNFKEDVSINNKIASTLKNNDSPSIIYNDSRSMNPMSEFEYINEDGTTTSEKPERVLLGQMEKYYKKPRRKIKLETERDEPKLHIVNITGYDDRKYIPLSRSVDWKANKSTIHCFEAPE